MMLVEEGAVAVDDPVEKFIPAWRDLGRLRGRRGPARRVTTPRRPMQVVDLLRHTSGLTYGFPNRSNVDRAYREGGVGVMTGGLSLEGPIVALADIPLEFSPGAAWNYSVSTDVLGYLVQAISGLSFQEFLRTRIIEPLGMVDTAFQVAPDKARRLSACYERGPDGALRLQDDPETSPFLKPPSFVSGGGGLTSTAADYLKFCQMLLNGGQAGACATSAARPCT